MGYLKAQGAKVGAWVAIVVGVIVLGVGWRGVWHTLDTARQIPYVVSGGMAGVFLLGLGAVLWVSSDLRQERGNLDAVAHQLEATGSLPPAEGTTADRPS